MFYTHGFIFLTVIAVVIMGAFQFVMSTEGEKLKNHLIVLGVCVGVYVLLVGIVYTVQCNSPIEEKALKEMKEFAAYEEMKQPLADVLEDNFVSINEYYYIDSIGSKIKDNQARHKIFEEMAQQIIE